MKHKRLFLSFLLVATLITTACSTTSNQGLSDKEKQEILNKFYTNFSALKSFKTITETTITEPKDTTNKNNTILKLESPTVIGSNDVEIKGHITIPTENTEDAPFIDNIHIFTKGDTIYLNVPSMTSGQWMKTTDSAIKENFEWIKNTSEFFELKDLFKEPSDKISIEEIEESYKLTYKEIDEEAQYLLGKNFDSSSKKLGFFEDYEKKFDGSVTFTVNKDTLQIESFMMSATSKDDSNPLSITSRSTFSDINNISEIKLSEAAKKAVTPDVIE